MVWKGASSQRSSEFNDDVVVLEIVTEPPPLRPSQIAVLGTPQLQARHSFKSLGFPQLKTIAGGYAVGEIVGRVSAPGRAPMRAEPIELNTRRVVQPGMSGSAVLDEEQNLIVGVIERSFIEPADAPGTGLAWAVDAHVLTFDPFLLDISEYPHPRRTLAPASINEEMVRGATAAHPGDYYMRRGTTSGVVARDRFMQDLLGHSGDPRRRMVALVGFGGEGKTTVASSWTARILEETGMPIFWWTFTTPEADTFFASALSHLTTGSLVSVDSISQRMDWLSMLIQRRGYIFVLDGLEMLQSRDDQRYGNIVDADLRTFLRRFAAKESESFCILTSRLPLPDLIDIPSASYVEERIQRLTVGEGVELLTNRGVQGSSGDMESLVNTWDGHALSLAVLAGFIVSRFDGMAAKARLLTPSKDQASDERLESLLGYYDEYLSGREKSILKIMSAFRGAIPTAWLLELASLDEMLPPDPSMIGISPEESLSIAKNLSLLSLLTHDDQNDRFDLHPLVRQHYREVLALAPREIRKALHSHIASRYYAAASQIEGETTLSGLTPLIEAVYHFCHCDQATYALQVYRERIEQGDVMRLSYRLNAYGTVSSLMDAFFPEEDFRRDPLLEKVADARYVVNRKAVALMNTGSLTAAAVLFERAVAIGEEGGDILGSCRSAQNLAEVNIYLGRLDASRAATVRALALADSLGDEHDDEVRDCHACLGWSASLAGRDEDALREFELAQEIQRRLEADPNSILLDIWGVAHADFLRIQGKLIQARRIAEANMSYARDNELVDNVSICNRLLGQLEMQEGDRHVAFGHLDAAVTAARSISERTVLLEALAARGRAHARYGNAHNASQDLEEAAQYAQGSAYRLLEIDVHIGLAWWHMRLGDTDSAGDEIVWCRESAGQTGYAWALGDVEELLGELAALQ